MLSSDAPEVGRGVPRAEVPKPPVAKTSKSKSSMPGATAFAESKEDGSEVWVDRPTIAGQLFIEGASKPDGERVQVFDLSQEEDRKALDELLTACQQPDTNLVIVHQERTAFEGINNWKVLVQTRSFKFRKILKTKQKAV